MTRRVLSTDQFAAHVSNRLGPQSSQHWWMNEHPDWSDTPSHVFRVMSEEDFRQSMERGYHKSDERNTYMGMARRGEIPKHEAHPEGTVAGRFMYSGYMGHSRGWSRVVKISVDPADKWEQHPDYEEGDAFRTFASIPTSRFRGSVRARVLPGGNKFEVS